MDKKKLKEIAEEILFCFYSDMEEKELNDINAMYYRNTDRGGGAVIISEDGGMLYVDPFFVDFDEHKKRFIIGERTVWE